MSTVNMEYRVLGYVSSESEAFVKPFWLVLKVSNDVRSIILENWLTAVGNIDWLGEEYIEDLLFVLKNQSVESKEGDEEGAEALFAQIADLDSGPLRTVAFGSASEQAPAFEAVYRRAEFAMECSREDMDALLGALDGSLRCLKGVAYG